MKCWVLQKTFTPFRCFIDTSVNYLDEILYSLHRLRTNELFKQISLIISDRYREQLDSPTT